MKSNLEPSAQEVLAGLVERVTFHSGENGFCVLRAKARGHCRFTLEPETGADWVKGGTEIETGASFSLNLSANFAALSGESGLLFDCGLPGFDDGV